MSNNQTLQTWADNYWKTIYPVGAIYQSMSTTSPASLFGGSWEKIENSFLYGSGTKSVGNTGGEENHTLSTPELPWHRHEYAGYHYIKRGWDEEPYTTFPWVGSSDPSASKGFVLQYSGWWNTDNITDGTSVVSVGWPHNNMPPYLVCSMWRRTA